MLHIQLYVLNKDVKIMFVIAVWIRLF